MVTLFKRSNGRYYAQFSDPNRTPARKQVSLGTSRQRDAVRKLNELEEAFRRGEYDPWVSTKRKPKRDQYFTTLGAAVEAFIKSRANLSPYTVAKYESVLGLFEAHLGARFDLSSLRTEHVQAFLDGSDRKAVTKKTYKTTLSPFFNWLKGQGILDENPADYVRLEKVPLKTPRFLEPEDVEAICRAIRRAQGNKHAIDDTGEWLIPIVRANVYLGLRAGEIVNLMWDHIDFERRTLTVANTESFQTKSGKDRVIPLCQNVLDILRSLPRKSKYVFPNYSGEKLHRQYLSRTFKRFATDAGLPHLNLHATRHTAASWLARSSKCSVEAIRCYMGHSSVTVTQRYMHLSQDVVASQIGEAFDSVPV